MARGLRSGLMLSRDLIQPGTWIPMLKTGTRLTPELISKIRRLGLEWEALGCIDRERPREPMGLAHFLLPAEVRSIQGVLAGRGDQGDLRQVVYDSTRRLARIPGALEFRIGGPYELSHPINAFSLSVAIGHALGYGPSQLVSLGTGALLHDMGKAMLPQGLLGKRGPLTTQDRELLRHHPAFGVAVLTRSPRYSRWLMSRDVVEIVRFHHERLDGTGYPDGLRGAGIPRMAMIVAVADIYDSMLSDRIYARRSPPGLAYQTIKSMAGHQLDATVVDAFMRRVMPYPAGTEVVLSDRRIARVIRSSAGSPLRPVVEVDGQDLDMSGFRSLEIVGIRLPRRTDRIDTAIPVRIKLGETHPVWGKTINLSAEGACIEIVGDIPAGSDLELQFCAGGATLAPVRAKVCWVRSGGDGTCQAGIYVRDGDLLGKNAQPERNVG